MAKYHGAGDNYGESKKLIFVNVAKAHLLHKKGDTEKAVEYVVNVIEEINRREGTH